MCFLDEILKIFYRKKKQNFSTNISTSKFPFNFHCNPQSPPKNPHQTVPQSLI